MLSRAPTKPCKLDPVPGLLKRFPAEITSAQIQLINMSLETGTVFENFKQALVRSLLKKPNLNATTSRTIARPIT